MNKIIPTKVFLSEIFQEANDSQDPVSVLQSYRQKEIRLTSILGYCIHPGFCIKNQIPDGEPPFKKTEYPMEKAIMNVLDLHNKLYIMMNPNLKRFKKEEFFVNWLESMHPTDAQILVAIKDQELDRLYPKLTKDVIRQSLGWTEEQYKSLFK
ncbi:MAG TPA: DUF6433 family protein [Methanosarcina sp.]|nr:DUF6433 family protein [Methanosarcina sp.]